MQNPERKLQAPEKPARALFLILLCLSVGGLAWGAWADYRALLDHARWKAVDLAATVNDRADAEIANAFDMLRRAERIVLADWTGDGRLQPRQIEALDDLPYPAPLATNLVVVDARGLPIYGREPIPEGADYSDRAYFDHVRYGALESIEPMFLGPVSGKPSVPLARRLEDEQGGFLGMVVVGIPPDLLTRPAVFGLDLGENGVAALLRREDMTVVARYPLPDLSKGQAPLRVPDVSSAVIRTPFVHVSPFDGVERLILQFASKRYPLVTVVGLSVDEIRKEWMRRQARILGAALPLLIIVLWLGMRTSNGFRFERAESAKLTSALSQRDMLLSEVHHRVKNNLQIIQSLLTMESLCAGDEARRGYEDSLQRIQAMGMVHELLYQSGEFGSIAVKEYLGRLCPLIVGQAAGVDVTVDGDEAELDIDRAVPFAMAMNEIVANTVKHAFADGRPGRVEVHVRRIGPDLEVAVADDGIGLPAGFDPAVSGNMGTRLVVGLARQLDGGVRFESAGGTVVRLTFPLVGEAAGAA